MSSQKPKLVWRQMILIICLILTLLVLTPAFAKSQGESFDLTPSDRVEGNTLISIKIDSDTASSPGQIVDVPILIRNSVAIGGFELEIDFCFQNLTFYGAERGEALSHMTHQRYDWEYFSYRVLPYIDTLYKLILYGQYDFPDGHPGVPLAPNPDYVGLVITKFQSPDRCLPSVTFFPIVFEWEVSDCAENTLTDSTGNYLYVSQDILQYDTTICPHGPSTIPCLEFLDGGVYALYDSVFYRGDITLNCVSYETADFLLFVQFLNQGPDTFWNPEKQYPATDINADGINVTIADLVYMDRVIMHDAPPFPESFHNDYPGSDKQTDKMILSTASADPGDTVSLPLFLDNTLPATGISCKIVFDSTLLSIQDMDTIGTRLQGWEQVHSIIKPGSLFLHAMPNYFGEPPSLDSMPAGSGALVKIDFLVSDQATPGSVISVEFQNDPYWQLYWGHYNAYTHDGSDFIQPATVSGWISVSTNIFRGDVTRDGVIDIADVVYLLNYLFFGGPAPNPLALGDTNCDGVVDIADVVFLLNYMFVNGPPPNC
jgi:hypothetical protein